MFSSLSIIVGTQIEQEECEVQYRLELRYTREYSSLLLIVDYNWNSDSILYQIEDVLLSSLLNHSCNLDTFFPSPCSI